MGHRPRARKEYAFHSRKARFKVYCASPGQQEALLQHVLLTEHKESPQCAIICPELSAEGQQRESASAKRVRGSPLAPELHGLNDLRKRRGREAGSSDDSDDDGDESSDDSNDDSNESSDDDGSSEDQDIVEQEGKKGPEGVYAYHIFLEHRTAQARSSKQ